MRGWMIWMGVCLCIVAPALAQNDCPTMVQQVLDEVGTICAATGRNQACYGNVSLTAEPQQGVTDFTFDAVGAVENLSEIAALQLEPMDAASGVWGVAMMQLQANLPDTMPGQNVTFLLFGDVRIENAAAPDQSPMQAFYLTTGVGDSDCAEAPESGVMVQTPEGSAQVNFTVNGVNVAMGSTVVFRAQPGEAMRVSTLEGAATLDIDGELFPVIEGALLEFSLGDDLLPTDELLAYRSYIEEDLAGLPLDLLQRAISIAPPLTDDQLDEFIDLWEEGGALCSDDADSFLPSCEHLPFELGGAACLFEDDGSGAPLCDLDQFFEDLGCVYPAALEDLQTESDLPPCQDACIPIIEGLDLPDAWADLPACDLPLLEDVGLDCLPPVAGIDPALGGGLIPACPTAAPADGGTQPGDDGSGDGSDDGSDDSGDGSGDG